MCVRCMCVCGLNVPSGKGRFDLGPESEHDIPHTGHSVN